eukprot:5673079-Amphidinium_carterae.1
MARAQSTEFSTRATGWTAGIVTMAQSTEMSAIGATIERAQSTEMSAMKTAKVSANERASTNG